MKGGFETRPYRFSDEAKAGRTVAVLLWMVDSGRGWNR